MRLSRRLAKSQFVRRSTAGAIHFLFEWSRYVGRERASRAASRVARAIGPRIREHHLGRKNLEAAFPEKTAAEREEILTGVWDNLARATIEYAFLQDLVESFDPRHPTGGVIEHAGLEHVYGLRDGGRPGIVFGAHLGNWELAAALGARLGVPVTAIYRPPRNPYVAAEIERRRNQYIGGLIVSGRGAAIQIANALRGGRHVGIVVDQRIEEGPELSFFGRPSSSNPMVGILARLFECPVHGARAIRRPDGSFWTEMTPPLELPRDAKGKVDATAVNVMVHGMIEQWIRETPEQWLWLHDRWRPKRFPDRPVRRR